MANTDDLANAPSGDRPAANGSSSADSGNVQICSGCHLPLVRRGPKGECLRCLMAFAFPAEDEEPPVPPSTPARPAGENAWRYGHFDIAIGADGHPVELGSGAMATTYRALDSVLHSAVALKVINQKVAEHPTARARFLREARAAAKLHHPNVASVSHYGEQNGECYYVMELVEGETLEARVRREAPLPPALVLDIGVQVARALAAAETCGVVHRDLKPSNIMLTTSQGEKTDGNASTVVKVIDWGLAKAVSAESGLGTDHTHGGFVGTPAFASPEQFSQATNRRIDHRSDIYSLGVTLWYLLCGRTPFTGTTLEEIHSRQVGQPVPLAQLTAARVPPRIVTLLKSMMAVDPAARPQSARELLDTLRACQRHFPVAGTAQESRRNWNRGLAFGLALILVAGAVLLGIWRHPRRAPVQAGDKSIAVLPFENLSPDKDDAFFASGFQDEITGGLTRLAALRVAGSSSTADYPPGKRDYAAIGRELGVAYLLEGSVRRRAGQLDIHLALVDARDSSRLWSEEYHRHLADVFAVKSEVAKAVARCLHAPLSPAEDSFIDAPPTDDLQAYDLYLRASAIATLQPSPRAAIDAISQAVPLLQSALARDPKFVLAYCSLANAEDTLYSMRTFETPEEQSIDHRALAEAALQRARRLAPDDGQVHLAWAMHFYRSLHDNDQARIELDIARQTVPHDWGLEMIAGDVAKEQGRWEDSVRAFSAAAALDPHSVISRDQLAKVYHLMRRYSDYERELSALMVIVPKDGQRYSMSLGLVSLERDADLTALRASLATMPLELQDEYWDLHTMVLQLCERDADAVSRTVATTTHAKFRTGRSTYPKSWFEALAARLRGDDAGAHAAFTTARAELDKVVTADPTDVTNLSVLAMIDAGLGRTEDALREGHRACEMLTPQSSAVNAGVANIHLAVVYAWVGQAGPAIAKLEEMASQPAAANAMPMSPTYGDLKLNPLWDPLRSDPRFDALVQRFAPRNQRP